MNIVICVDCLTNGGAQRVAAMWTKGFIQKGHHVSLIISNIRVPITYDIPSEVPIYNIDFKINNGYFRHIIKILFQHLKLKRILESIKPDLVISVHPSWGPLIFRAKGNLQFKVVGTDHNSYERPYNEPMSKRTKWLKFDFSKRFNAVTVLTQADKNVIGNKLNNVFVLPNPLALTRLNKLPPKKKNNSFSRQIRFLERQRI